MHNHLVIEQLRVLRYRKEFQLALLYPIMRIVSYDENIEKRWNCNKGLIPEIVYNTILVREWEWAYGKVQPYIYTLIVEGRGTRELQPHKYKDMTVKMSKTPYLKQWCYKFAEDIKHANYIMEKYKELGHWIKYN